MIDVISEEEILALLESSHNVLHDKSETCKDARRVSHIVRLILDKPRPLFKHRHTASYFLE
jgi:hypothetical protein